MVVRATHYCLLATALLRSCFVRAFLLFNLRLIRLTSLAIATSRVAVVFATPYFLFFLETDSSQPSERQRRGRVRYSVSYGAPAKTKKLRCVASRFRYYIHTLRVSTDRKDGRPIR